MYSANNVWHVLLRGENPWESRSEEFSGLEKFQV